MVSTRAPIRPLRVGPPPAVGVNSGVNTAFTLAVPPPSEKVADMWEYHGYVLQMILDYNGGNECPKHRPKAVKDASKNKRQRRL